MKFPIMLFSPVLFSGGPKYSLHIISISVLISGQETSFHTHTKQQVKSVLLTLIFNFSKRRREDKMGEADDSPPSRGEVKNAWSYTSMPKRAFTAWFLFRHKTRLHDVVLS